MSANEILAAVVTLLGILGGGIGYLLKHLSAQRDLQRKHEDDAWKRHEEITNKFNETIKDILRDSRDENRRTTELLLTVQKETIGAIHELGQEVGLLSISLREMKGVLDQKADKST